LLACSPPSLTTLLACCPAQACDAAAFAAGEDAGPGEIDNFLRVQAVAFSANATITSNCLFEPPTLDGEKPYDMVANYYPIDTSNGNDEKAKEARQFADALSSLDKPNDWPVLREVGKKMSEHFRQDIRRWVRKYIFSLEAANVR
jgi:hypothetical protein